MENKPHGVGKVGIHEEPLNKILNALDVEEAHEQRTVHSNPMGLDCPCCDEIFQRAIVSESAWSMVGAGKPLQVCVGDTPDGRILFAHILEDGERIQPDS